jgi:hypothetical protein
MSVNARNGILFSAISHLNAIAKASIGAINGQTADTGGGPTELASDTFTSATDQALTTYSGSWSYVQGTFVVNAAADVARSSASSVTCMARWNAVTFNAAQYSQVVFDTLGGGVYYGPGARLQSGAATGYHVDTDGSDNYLVRTDAGADTVLASGAGFVMTLAAGDVCRLEVTTPDGSTVRCVVKKALAASPTSFSTILTFDDTSGSRITTAGYAGIFGFGDNTSTAGGPSSWSAGNL